ncbi:hypothetical protein TNIN_2791 [Trichonephila inaurata madagascariensis]|uniref:Uncharacterized protein n=1 Tax=Trichonephila inaurata madagascariensis TaxID=2747483 RepID=A0A8X7CKK0_9ARAC|nr:hypothetical protein TNIN_2791 [Trichonephila inaurata madagascariensis]
MESFRPSRSMRILIRFETRTGSWHVAKVYVVHGGSSADHSATNVPSATHSTDIDTARLVPDIFLITQDIHSLSQGSKICSSPVSIDSSSIVSIDLILLEFSRNVSITFSIGA